MSGNVTQSSGALGAQENLHLSVEQVRVLPSELQRISLINRCNARGLQDLKNVSHSLGPVYKSRV
jgi:hypothetical protein